MPVHGRGGADIISVIRSLTRSAPCSVIAAGCLLRRLAGAAARSARSLAGIVGPLTGRAFAPRTQITPVASECFPLLMYAPGIWSGLVWWTSDVSQVAVFASPAGSKLCLYCSNTGVQQGLQAPAGRASAMAASAGRASAGHRSVLHTWQAGRSAHGHN